MLEGEDAHRQPRCWQPKEECPPPTQGKACMHRRQHSQEREKGAGELPQGGPWHHLLEALCDHPKLLTVEHAVRELTQIAGLIGNGGCWCPSILFWVCPGHAYYFRHFSLPAASECVSPPAEITSPRRRVGTWQRRGKPGFPGDGRQDHGRPCLAYGALLSRHDVGTTAAAVGGAQFRC